MKQSAVLFTIVAAILAGCAGGPVSVPVGQKTTIEYGDDPHVALAIETALTPAGLYMTFENLGDERWTIWSEGFYYHLPNGKLVQHRGDMPGSAAYMGVPLAFSDLPVGHTQTYGLSVLLGCDKILYKDRGEVRFALLLK